MFLQEFRRPQASGWLDVGKKQTGYVWVLRSLPSFSAVAHHKRLQ